MQVHEVQLEGRAFPFKSSYFTVQPDCETPVDSHSVHEMWMVAQGQGELMHDGNVFAISAPDVLYLEPPKPHVAKNTGREPLVIFSVWWT
ncbi:MAG: cupin domain-containing protein [Candidatus Angelobacter sp.]